VAVRFGVCPFRALLSRSGRAPFPASPLRTVHAVLPHTARPRVVGVRHSAPPRALAAHPSRRPSDTWSPRVNSLSAIPLPRRWAAHSAGGPSLQRVLLSASSSLLWPPPTPAPLSPVSRLITAYRARRSRSTPKMAPRESHCRGGDGSLLFPHRLCQRSTPSTPPGSSGLRFQALHPFPGLRRGTRGSAPGSAPCGGNLHDAAGFA